MYDWVHFYSILISKTKMEYLEVLKKDKLLATIIKEPLKLNKQENDLYLQLLKAIAGQQLSTKAAATIWLRFENLFNSH